MSKLTVIITGIVLLFTSTCTKAQTSVDGNPHRVVYAELFGNGLIMSFSYDQRVRKRPDGLGFRVGLGGMAANEYTNITIPVALNYLAGKEGKYFEVGIGATYSSLGLFEIDDLVFPVVGTLTFGYRKQPVDGGFLWRIGLSPVFGMDQSPGGRRPFFLPYFPHLGLGYAF